MSDEGRIRIAIQKSGRLSERSMDLLGRCGLNLEWAKNRLFSRCENFPLDLMLLRDDDIPEYVSDGVCDLGIVGFNMLQEKLLSRGEEGTDGVEILKKLDFGHCRLALAVPIESKISAGASARLSELSGLRIATSYPATLRRFLKRLGISAEIVQISGSVEIAPALRIADAICDLVSTGTTLKSNGLREIETVLESSSILVRTRAVRAREKDSEIHRLLARIDGVQRALQTKYIMMNAPARALGRIRSLIPGMEEPTIMPLGKDGERIAIHAVARENIFWETMEALKSAGASSILVMPIEKIIA